MSKLLEQLVEFHESKDISTAEKAGLYLSGVSALSIETMNETNASEFKISATVNQKDTGKTYQYVFTITENTNEE